MNVSIQNKWNILGLAALVCAAAACASPSGSGQGSSGSESGNGGSGNGGSGGSGGSSGGGSGSSGGSSSGSSGGPAATWTELYNAYFGPNGMGTCGLAGGVCHNMSGDTGVTMSPPNSGFVCGTSSDSCYKGMMNATTPLFPKGGSQDPGTTVLEMALCTTNPCSSGVTSDNMPFGLAITYASSDIDKISSWLKAGAQEN